MNAASVESQLSVGVVSRRSSGHETTWPRHRWWGVVGLIYAAQLGVVFWLGARHPVTPRVPFPTPPISLVGERNSELAELIDPTLFALPNRNSFSGLAWAMTPRSEFVSADWTEPMRWLPVSQEKLGESFKQLLAEAAIEPPPIAEKGEPNIALPGTLPNLPAVPVQSLLQMEGGLAGRALLNPPVLSSWPSADILLPSVVQVMVDAGGYVVSATLLSSSGLGEADQAALDLAKAARFEPLRDSGKERLLQPLNNLSWGKMVFQWQTIAPPTGGELGTAPNNP